MDDYVEVLYELLAQKGYARVVDISAHLGVKSPTATAMLKRLAATGTVRYEKYRGITLTRRGIALAKFVRERHGILTEFLKLLGVPEDTAHADVEGIEHHVQRETLERIRSFVEFARDHPEWMGRYRAILARKPQAGHH